MQPPDADQRSRLLATLLDEHGAALALYAAQWTTAADDCVQEALVELARQEPTPDHPVAWLYRVVKRRALDHTRGERRRTQRQQVAWQARLDRTTTDDVARQLLDAVDTLPADLRELVLMKIWGGLTLDEMAVATGQSTSAVHRHYHQALERLRHLWGISCPIESTQK